MAILADEICRQHTVMYACSKNLTDWITKQYSKSKYGIRHKCRYKARIQVYTLKDHGGEKFSSIVAFKRSGDI